MTSTFTGQSKKSPSSLSVVIPCFNEEEVLLLLYKRLELVLSQLSFPYEVILVDDGSNDNTWEIISQFATENSHYKAVRLSRNYGHQFALTCGLDAAQGEVVLVIDADLQDPPELLFEMLDKWREGYSVVYGQRIRREGESSAKRFFAFVFYRLLEKIASVRIPRDTGDFRLIDRKALDALNSLREKHRFIRGMFSWVGFSQTSIQYQRPMRVAGETKYPFKKSLLLAMNAVLSFSYMPLKISSYLGCLLFVFMIMFDIANIVWKFVSLDISLIVNLLSIIGAFQMLAIGMLGEYVGRVFEQAQNRPLYLVDEVRGQGLS